MPLAVLAVVQIWPAAQERLQFDRAAIASGQCWRVLTGNFVHYTWYHWAANVGAFAALAWTLGKRPQAVIATVIVSACCVGAGLFFLNSDVAHYRGISGVDCALLAAVLVRMVVEDHGWTRWIWWAVLLLLGAKSVYEAATGQVLLPTSAPPGVCVVGATHVVGLTSGLLVALWCNRPLTPRGSGRFPFSIRPNEDSIHAADGGSECGTSGCWLCVNGTLFPYRRYSSPAAAGRWGLRSFTSSFLDPLPRIRSGLRSGKR